MNKAKLNEELREKVEGLREGCFPRPKGVGCRCVEKDAEGHDGEKIFETDAECKVSYGGQCWEINWPLKKNHKYKLYSLPLKSVPQINKFGFN
jgi:hypothetical protein